jgi:serine protease Do
MAPLRPTLADAYGLDALDVRGAVEIATVNPDEPASMAGVEVGDIVVGTDGVELEDDQDLLQRIAMTPPDASIELNILRMTPDDSAVGLTPENRSISVMLGERPPEIDVLADQQATTPFAGLRRSRNELEDRELTAIEERFGMVLSEVDANLASELEYRASEGGLVVLGTLEGSFAADMGFAPGIVIRRVNMRRVDSIEEFAALIANFAPGELAVFDLRLPNGQSQRFPLEIPQ